MAKYRKVPTQAVITRNEIRPAAGLGARIRNLHQDYKKAMAMTMAGKTDAEIVAELNLPHIDEDALKKNMQNLLTSLHLTSFQDPVLQARPVRRALKNFWVPDFEPE